jgi:hypothetical protein
MLSWAFHASLAVANTPVEPIQAGPAKTVEVVLDAEPVADPAAPVEPAAPADVEPLDTGELAARLARTEEELQATRGQLAETEARIQALEQTPMVDFEGLVEPTIVGPGERVDEVVAWGPVSVQGMVDGRVVSFGHDVRIFEGGNVHGDAVSFGGQVRVDPGAQVHGDRISYASTAAAPQTSPVFDLSRGTSALRRLARRLVVILTFAGAGVLVVGLFPTAVENVSRAITDRPLKMGALGMASAAVGAVLTIGLLLSVILSPVGVLLPVVFGLAGLLGFVGLCQAAGDKLPIGNSKARRWLAFLVGVALISIIGVLPFIGQLALVIVGFACIGAALATRFGTKDITAD